MAIDTKEIDLKQTGAPKQAKVALAQTKVPDPSKICPDIYLNPQEKIDKKTLLKSQRDLITNQLKRALLDEPDFILFPELSIPWDMQDELRKYVVEKSVYIIGGLTYGPKYENACCIFPPFECESLPLQYKLNRAPREDENVKTGQRILIFKNSGFGTFASVICYDFTSLRIGGLIRDHDVNILFLPTLNRAVDLFDGMASGQSYTLYTYICLCNAAGGGLGNSASYGPVRALEGERLPQERVLNKITGNQEIILPTTLDVRGLLESIERFKDNKEVLPGFITPPSDLREPGVLISPYTPLGPAKENFVGRDSQIREFWAHIESNHHVLLLGPSGTGKTSLIYRLKVERSLEFRTGYIEIYDSDHTFDFFRRLSREIISISEAGVRNIQFEQTLQAALDDIRRTRDAVAQYGFEESSKAFEEAFHRLAQAINAQSAGKIVIFIDQAERLAWLEEDEKRHHAIRILIRIMRDLDLLGMPVLFVAAIREHDYDPLIALASDQLPVQVIPLRKFSKDDAILAIEKPLPPGITIDHNISSEIADISRGIPFFVQLLADATFKKLGQRRVISSQVFEDLHIRDLEDTFPLLMHALTPLEQRFLEAMGMCHEYTVGMEDIVKELAIDPGDLRHTYGLLLGKNVIESLENGRVRFVHDKMKGFIQREWLAAKMSNREKLGAETDTALQMLLLSPEDVITVKFSIPSVALCCFKSLLLDDVDNLSRIVELTASLKNEQTVRLCERVLETAFRCVSRNVFNTIRLRVATLLEKNEFYSEAANILAIEIMYEERPNSKAMQRALDFAERLANEYRQAANYSEASSWHGRVANWVEKIGNEECQKEIYEKIISFRLKYAEETEKRNYSEASSLYAEAAQWAKNAGDEERLKEIYEKIISFHLKYAGAMEEEDHLRASSSYAKAAQWAKNAGDEEGLKEIYEKIISFHLKYAGAMEERNYSKASSSYAKAAQWAKNAGDEEGLKEIYEKIISFHLKYAGAMEEEDYFRASSSIEEAAQWAKKAGDEERLKEIYEKIISFHLEYAGAMEEEDYFRASSSYAEAAQWAKKAGDEERLKEIYEKIISFHLKYAGAVEERNYSKASFRYEKAVQWAEQAGDEEGLKEIYEKIISFHLKYAGAMEEENYREASSSYEKAVQWAKNAGDEERLKELYEKIISFHLKYAGAMEEENYPDASSSYEKAVQWAEQAGDEEGLKEIYEKIISFHLKYAGAMEEENYHEASSSYEKAVQWAKNAGDEEGLKEIYEKIISFHLKYAGAMEERNYSKASSSYAKAAQWAKSSGDEERLKEIYEKIISFHLKYAGAMEEENYPEASFRYLRAAQWAKNAGDEERLKEIYEKIISFHLKYAGAMEEENYPEASSSYEKAVQWAKNAGDEEGLKEIYEKIISFHLKYAGAMEEEDYFRASSSYEKAVQWAEQAGDEERLKEIYEKAIYFLLKHTETMEEKGSLSSASIGYAQAAKWTDHIGDTTGRERFYERAAQALQEAAETYEKLASFLLNNDTSEAASALCDYFSDDNERFTYFKKISSISEGCRRFFGEIEEIFYQRTLF
ncbi:MAG: AAA family ATPase [Theionarchaea archaeon]|nr:AAA family ATPase [Theionarchaea archaeon]